MASWQDRPTNADGGKSTLGIRSPDPTQKAFLEETDRKRKKKTKQKTKNLIPSCKKSLIRTGALNKQWKVNERVKERERQRERQRQRQRDREKDRETERETERQRDRTREGGRESK